MRTRSLLSLLCLISLLAVAAGADAKDLRKRFALGFNNQFSPVAAISAKFTLPAARPTTNVQIQVLGGVALFRARAANNDQFFAGARMLFTFLAEDNLNLYAGGGAGYAGFSDGARAIRVHPVVGVEFFFFGLENLGFSGELGVNVDIGTSPVTSVDLSTAAGSFGAVGVHYYF